MFYVAKKKFGNVSPFIVICLSSNTFNIFFPNGAVSLVLPRFRKDLLRVKQVGERGR